MKKDKKKLFKAGIIFCVWLIAVFYIGSNVSKSSTEHSKANPKITQSVSPTGEGLPDSEKTTEQKENTKKLISLNQKTTNNDMNKLANALKVSPNDGWEGIGTKNKDGIPTLRAYFPQGQNQSAWREALVLRAFVNLKIKEPIPTVYNIYEEWLKEQVPDLQLEHSEDSFGTKFSGYSAGSKIYISGKVFTGSLKEIVYIAQYIIKDDGLADVNQKAKQWTATLGNIQ